MARRKKNNPGFISIATCNMRYGKIKDSLDVLKTQNKEILQTLAGNPKDHTDLGLQGDVQVIKKTTKLNRKIIYALIALFGTPVLILIINYILSGGG